MLALGKTEEGAIRGTVAFPCNDVSVNAMWGVQSQYFLWLKTTKACINVAQMASVLHVAVASVFIGFAWALLYLYFTVREGGLYARQNYLCMNLQ